MNAEIYQAASIVVSSKKALSSGKTIEFKLSKYENKIEFSLLPEKELLLNDKYTAPDTSTWFAHIKGKGLEDIKLMMPIEEKERSLLGFVNTSRVCILCFFKNKTVSYFAPEWKFDKKANNWNIKYKEHEYKNPPPDKPAFKNNRNSFKKVLVDIRDLAFQIGGEYFGNTFNSAIEVLDGKTRRKEEMGIAELSLPKEQSQLFEAAAISDVFGAMGSWNDSPQWAADDKGLSNEYEMLSNELLINIRLAILYAVNEW